MSKLSKVNEYVIQFFEIGYNINKDGNIIRKNLSIKSIFPENGSGYQYITVRLPMKYNARIPIHKIQAYKKFGSVMFEKGILVRHLDGNPLNNSWDNIEIGTNSDNMMDRGPKCRKNSATIATRKMQDIIRSYEDRCKIYEDLKNEMSYNEIMKKHNISSKGTLSFMKNKSEEYKEYLNK